MTLATILFLIGLILLITGGKLLVVGASELGLTLKVPPLLIGLTVVAFATSSPEIAVCLLAAWRDQSALVVGNLVGSNIFNILLVLGVAASIFPLVVKRQLIRWDVPVMIGVSLIFWLLAARGEIGRFSGLFLLLGLIAYIIFSYKKAEPGGTSPTLPLWKQLLAIGVGVVFLGIGSELLVSGATDIARYLGVGELAIGLTIVAVGTSLPELTTSLVAIRRKEGDLAVGNIVGSNIFNLLGVAGVTALLSKGPIEVPPKAIWFDIPVMVGVSVAALPIFLTGHLISRWEGALFLAYYALYILYLFFAGTVPLFTAALLFFILPLTLITLLIGVVRHLKSRN